MDTTLATTRPTATCRHRWLIEPAQGPTSRGVCTHCHVSRDFYNDPELVVIDRADSSKPAA